MKGCEFINIAEKLSALRKNRSVSVYKLSKLTDISENHIHDIEKSKKNPSVFVLEKLLTALGITLAEFFNEGSEVLYPTPFELEFINTIRLMGIDKAQTLLQIAKYINEK